MIFFNANISKKILNPEENLYPSTPHLEEAHYANVLFKKMGINFTSKIKQNRNKICLRIRHRRKKLKTLFRVHLNIDSKHRPLLLYNRIDRYFISVFYFIYFLLEIKRQNNFFLFHIFLPPSLSYPPSTRPVFFCSSLHIYFLSGCIDQGLVVPHLAIYCHFKNIEIVH